MSYTLRQYREDLSVGLMMAVGFTGLAAIPLVLLGVVNLVAMLRDRPLEMPWLTYGATCLVVPGSYFAAAVVGASTAFLLRPARSWLIGWALTGAAVAGIIYGAVGVALALFFDPVGAVILEHSTPQEAWALIPFLLAILTPVGAIIGLYMGWRDRRGIPIWGGLPSDLSPSDRRLFEVAEQSERLRRTDSAAADRLMEEEEKRLEAEEEALRYRVPNDVRAARSSIGGLEMASWALTP